MTTVWQPSLVKCKYEAKYIVSILLAIVRIGICFWPQTGYLHPDEFFQSVDVAGGNYFNSKVENVWEFKTQEPIRTVLFSNLLNYMAFMLAKSLATKPSAYLLLVMPRLFYTLLSFIIDLSLYKLCPYYSSRTSWYLPVSIIFQSSFICTGCLTRTFSNTIEVVFLSLLLVVVCQTFKPRFKIVFVTPSKKSKKSSIHERVKGPKQLISSIMVGIIVACGSFNRPTFPCFAIVPCIYWLVESIKRNSYSLRLTIHRVIVPISIATLVTSVIITLYDTYYYRGSQIFIELWNLLLHLDISQFLLKIKEKWIVTPYHFIKFNSNFRNLEQFGYHKPYIHFLVNLPLAFNLMGLLFLFKLTSLILKLNTLNIFLTRTIHRHYSLMILSTLIPILILSFIPHQEFRFLAPIIVPLTYLFASEIYASNKLLSLWFILNTLLLYFYSSIHQSGVTQAILDLDPLLRSHPATNTNHISVLAFRCYIVPTYQWNVPMDDNKINFYLHDTHVDLIRSLDLKINEIVKKCEADQSCYYQSYVMLHKLYERSFTKYMDQHFNSTNVQIMKSYSPHFSGEELSQSIDHIRQNGIKEWKTAFGFSLLNVTFTH